MEAQSLTGEPPVTREETVVSLLRKSQRRGTVPFRRTFVQAGEQGRPQPGPLASLVRNRDALGLDLYLLHRALASGKPYDTKLPAATWGRMVGVAGTGASSTISRAWTRLAKLRLIERQTGSQFAVVRSLREDGSGVPYASPGLTPGDVYFKLPMNYWLDGYDRLLTLAGKAMLLIFLSLKDGSSLPAEQAPAWYGVSADTAERGIRELRDRGLLWRTPAYRRTPLVASGFTKVYRYTINPAFKKRRKLVAVVPGPSAEGVRAS